MNYGIKLLGLATAAFACASMRADFATVAQPTASYVNGTTLLSFTDPDGTVINSLSGGGQTLSYSSGVEERTVPNSWSTWNSPPYVESSTPRVGFTDEATALTISLSQASTTFGFELEPDAFQQEEVTADYYSGATLVGTIDLSPNGTSGALLYAASTTTNPFTSVTINDLAGGDFAIAQQRFATASTATPEPASLALVGSALLGAVGLVRKRAKRS